MRSEKLISDEQVNEKLIFKLHRQVFLGQIHKHHAGFNMMERRQILIWIVTGLLQMTICFSSWASDLSVQGFNSNSESCRVDIKYQPDKPLETKWLINSKNQTLSQNEECGINVKSFPNKLILRAYNPNENAWQELNLDLNDKKEIIFFSEKIGAKKEDIQSSCESFIRIRKYIQFCDVKSVNEIDYQSVIDDVTKITSPIKNKNVTNDPSQTKKLPVKNSPITQEQKTKKKREASKEIGVDSL